MRPAQAHLKVPYFTQLNNQQNPYGACNVTSLAMVLRYYGIERSGEQELDDELYTYIVERYGYDSARHEPGKLLQTLRDYGWKQNPPILSQSYFKTNATTEEVKASIAAGNPCIVHGYFTNSGHIVVFAGYDENAQQWIVNDPYGEYPYVDNSTGEAVRISYELIANKCYPDGEFWVHFPIR